MATKVNPRILSGFMELLPEDQILFVGMLDKIRFKFEQYGFAPIDTPVMELSEILFAKGGGDTEKEIYRIGNRGDDISLRYDFTVPLARYVAQRYGQLTFPFRRYQIGKVYRAERPSRGRYREICQCDIDVVGSESAYLDAEMAVIIYDILSSLNLGTTFTIKVSNRKILTGFLEYLSLVNNSTEILRNLDKLEKIGEENVADNLSKLGVTSEQVEKIMQLITIKGGIEEVVTALEEVKVSSVQFRSGVDELTEITQLMRLYGVPNDCYEIDLSMVRGLDYYTGTIYETVLDEYRAIGTICAGGRYDNLSGYYTSNNLPGIGVSFGLTRLFFQLKEAGLITPKRKVLTDVLICTTSSDYLGRSVEIAKLLREKGFNTDVYPQQGKLTNPLKYANRLGIPIVLIIGENEYKNGQISVKSLSDGKQRAVPVEALGDLLMNLLAT